jgi:hypothetical protein
MLSDDALRAAMRWRVTIKSLHDTRRASSMDIEHCFNAVQLMRHGLVAN